MIHSWALHLCRTAGPLGLLLLVLGACTREPPARTVTEFVDNPRLLEATMLRCAENRLELKYTEECLNAREAVNRIAAQEDAARRKELEAQSTRKREALRRAQEAAVEARARAAEAERQRREAEYLGQFDENGSVTGDSAVEPPPMPPDNSAGAQAESYAPPPGNRAGAQVETYSPSPDNSPGAQVDTYSPPPDNSPGAQVETYSPPPDSAPTAALVDPPAAAEPVSGSLESVREELQRRQQEADNQ